MAGHRQRETAGLREEERGCASDAISMQPTRNGLARPRYNGAIPSSDSGMCSCAGLYLLHLHSRHAPSPTAVSGAPEPISIPGPPPMASRDAPALPELYCPCQPASLHALRGVRSATSPPCPSCPGPERQSATASERPEETRCREQSRTGCKQQRTMQIIHSPIRYPDW